MMIDNLPYRQVAVDDLRPGGLLCVADHASNHVPEDIELGIDPVHFAILMIVNMELGLLTRLRSEPATSSPPSRIGRPLRMPSPLGYGRFPGRTLLARQ